jgi:serine O-acetyltransferase
MDELNIATTMIKNHKDYLAYIKADALANSKQTRGGIKAIIFPDLIWSFIKALRKTECHKNQSGIIHKLLFVWYYSRYRKLGYKLQFSIPLNVFGPGISIPHYGTIVVNGNSRIGKNCRIHASTNIGASGGSNFAPVIGDNVYLGPGSILFGEIVIASNVTVAANATVYKSFEEENITIGGTPATLLKENTTVWWEKNGLSL